MYGKICPSKNEIIFFFFFLESKSVLEKKRYSRILPNKRRHFPLLYRDISTRVQ